MTINEIKNVKTIEKKRDWMEFFGYAALALTVLGQIAVNVSALWGQGIWLVANALFLTKAVKQDLGKAEISRNVVMSALTAGLMILNFIGIF